MENRISNISFEERINLKGEKYVQILNYYPNELFNLKDEYIKKGYIEKSGFLEYERYKINIECFNSQECCYVLADVYVDFRETDIYLKTIGNRVLELSKDELIIFFEVYKNSDTFLRNKYLKSEDNE